MRCSRIAAFVASFRHHGPRGRHLLRNRIRVKVGLGGIGHGLCLLLSGCAVEKHRLDWCCSCVTQCLRIGLNGGKPFMDIGHGAGSFLRAIYFPPTCSLVRPPTHLRTFRLCCLSRERVDKNEGMIFLGHVQRSEFSRGLVLRFLWGVIHPVADECLHPRTNAANSHISPALTLVCL